MKKYAPVLIPTLNRTEHLKKLITSLQKNDDACHTDIYISLDYPPATKYNEGYKNTKEYLETGISGFNNVTIIYQDYNLGPRDNMYFLFREAQKKHDRFIFTEDDNEFSPDFLDYMNQGLELSEHDSHIFTVCGYKYPVMLDDTDDTVIVENSLFSAFGYGMLYKNYNEICNQLTVGYWRKCIHSLRISLGICKGSKTNFCDFVTGVINGSRFIIDENDKFVLTDATIGLYMLMTHKYALMPKISLVRNCGYDGSGQNCASEIGNVFQYSKQEIDTNKHYIIKCRDYHHARAVNQKHIDRYVPIKETTIIHAWIVRNLYIVLGSRRKYHDLGNKLRRLEKVR